MNEFLNPKSIAIIGASLKKKKVGYQILSNILKFNYKGKTYPVNLNENEILGLKSYKSILDIPGKIDMVVIAIPRNFVLAELVKCVNKGIKNFVIISAGFSEFDLEGKLIQQKMLEISNQNNLNILGPNCLGFFSSGKNTNLNVSFASKKIKNGKVSLISQSGAIISSIIDYANINNFGFSKIFSIGNRLTISENDILEYLINDKQTEKILIYLESFSDQKRFLKIISKNVNKQIIILIGGKSKIGSDAAISHTASIISKDNKAFCSILEKKACILVKSLSDFFGYANNCGNIIGNRIGIISNAGGPVVSTIDQISKSNLVLAPIKNNPNDLLGDANENDFQKAIDLFSNEKNLDVILTIITPQSLTNVKKIAQNISLKNQKKKLVTSFIGGYENIKAKEILLKRGIPFYEFPENFIKQYSQLIQSKNYKKTKNIKQSKIDRSQIKYIDNIFKNTNNFHLKSYQSVKALGFNVPLFKFAINYSQVVKSANEIGFPIILKTASEQIIHKKKSNGILENICNHKELKEKYFELSKLSNDVILQAQIGFGTDLFIGFKKELSLGNVFSIGLGGSNIEKLNLTAFLFDPITEYEYSNALKKTKIKNILSKQEQEYFKQILIKIQVFINKSSNIIELDLNPIRFIDGKAYILDSRIITN